MKRFIGLIAISILASCNTPLENGLDHFSNKEFEDAIRKFEMIDPSDESYDSAQKMIELANVQINLLKRDDFPTLGLPMIATFKGSGALIFLGRRLVLCKHSCSLLFVILFNCSLHILGLCCIALCLVV